MDLFDFNHDGEVSDLERIMGLAAVLSEANPDVVCDCGRRRGL